MSFFVKAATWANNTQIPLCAKAKTLNTIWQLNLSPRIKMFVWKLIRRKRNTEE